MSGAIVWVASYPKSGNTWVRAALTALIGGGEVDINQLSGAGRSAATRHAFDATLGLSSADLDEAVVLDLRPRVYELWSEETKAPLVCKIHDALALTPSGEWLVPPAATRAVIHVVRDPRAVAVSLAHHMDVSIDEAITAMAGPLTLGRVREGVSQQLVQRVGSWSDHIRSWLAAPPPVQTVRYEDLITSPRPAFESVAHVAGLTVSADDIARAIEATRFEVLRDQERRSGFAERPRAGATFFREGLADGWRTSLTPPQATRIVDDHRQVMERLGYL